MSAPTASPSSALRTVIGGFLMGVANLVPGVSGGTMILAIGLYDRFIEAVAKVTSLRLDRATIVFVGLIGIGLVVAIVGLASPAVWLVTTHRWVAYSLFLGMTLGGVPSLLPYARPFGVGEVIAALVGFGAMAAVFFGLSDAALPHTWVVFVAIGALASSSMILPGISGSYILLIFGLYDVIVGSIRPSVLMEDFGGSLGILVPVAVGVVLGIGLLSNVLERVLKRFERPAHNVLLGLLVGSVLGLWPFQEAVHPELVSREGVKAVELVLAGEDTAAVEEATGVVLTAAEHADLGTRYRGKSKGELKLLGLQLHRYRPDASRIGLALVLFAVGFGLTRLIGRGQNGKPEPTPPS